MRILNPKPPPAADVEEEFPDTSVRILPAGIVFNDVGLRALRVSMLGFRDLSLIGGVGWFWGLAG